MMCATVKQQISQYFNGSLNITLHTHCFNRHTYVQHAFHGM